MKTLTVLVLLTLFIAGQSGPIAIASDQCAKQCKVTDTSKFNYVPGTTYEFEYNVQTQTAMEGASSERAALGIKATANIEVLSKCDLALRLRDVKVYRSDPSSSTPLKYADESGEFKRNLERSPLRFSFQDGVVEELCPLPGESTWALNIKRGLLTAFQNSMASFYKDETVTEKDVTGECSTDYSVRRGWFVTTIKKNKDLLGCTDRDGYRSSIRAMPYRVPSEIQSLPLMKSTHECEQEVDKNGLLKSAMVREIHTFRPFSHGTNGATTRIIQKLKYKTKRRGLTIAQEAIHRRVGLVFEHTYGSDDNSLITKNTEVILREFCRNSHEDTRPETPRLFSELIYSVKKMTLGGLKTVFQNIKQGTLCGGTTDRGKKFFLDSLLMASTSVSVQFMKEMLLSNEVTGVTATMWITSLSFIRYPTPEMLQAVKDLLNSPKYKKEAMLPISTMVNNYCNHYRSCSEEVAVTSIIAEMEEMIGRNCYVKDSNMDNALLALRALGNAGHLERLTYTLSGCFRRTRNPIAIRVTAIQAYRRLPCTSDRSDVVDIYQDDNEDSEVRIAAYLTIMECPSESLLSMIQKTLEMEKSSQVGSFVWTHLTNLIDTSSPLKQSIKRLIKDRRLFRPFDMDKLKYSRNYEISDFVGKINMGGIVDSNLIFSEKFLVPLSLSLNMSVDLFGNSFSLLELGGRLEGLEHVMQKYLDKNNCLRTGTLGKEKANLNSITDNLNSLKGDVYLRMFGNELYYNYFKGSEAVASAKKFNFLEMLIKISRNKDYSFSQNAMFLDTSMVIPTTSGLPLSLTVNGSATIDLQASGKMDLRKLATSPRSMLIDGVMKPSGAIQIAGTMSMDAFVTKSGLRVVNTWHSSTVLKGRVELTRGKILNVDLDFPQKKMEILDVSTAFFSIHGDQVNEQGLLPDGRKTLELCTGSRLATVTGLEICNEFQWTNASGKPDAPYFPFTGPFSQSLILHKRDTHTGYKLMAKRSVTKDSTVAQFALNTPDSKTDRTVELKFELIDKAYDKQIEVKLVSPWKKANLEGALYHNKKKIGVSGKMITDNTKQYGIVGEVGIKKSKNLITYIPHLEVSRPGAEAILLSGQMSYEGLTNADVDLALSGVKSNDIILKGHLSNIRNRKMTKSSITGVFSLDPGKNYSADAGVVYLSKGGRNPLTTTTPTLIIKTPQQEIISLTGSGDYRKGKSLKSKWTLEAPILTKKPITLECNLQGRPGRKARYTGNLKINSEMLMSKLSGNVHNKKGAMSSTFSLDYNLPKVRTVKPDKITVKTKFMDRSKRGRNDFKVNLHFTDKRRPHINFVAQAELSHQQKQTEVDASLKYGHKLRDSSKHVTANTLVRHDLTKNSANIDYTMKFGLGPADLSTDIQGNYSHNHQSVMSTTLLTYGDYSRQRRGMKRLSMDVQIYRNGTSKSGSFKSAVTVSTPFNGYESLYASTECSRGKDGIGSLAKLSWGAEKDIIIDIFLKPPSRTNNGLTLNIMAATPFEGFKIIKAALAHSTQLKGNHVDASFLCKSEGNLVALMDLNLRHGKSGVSSKLTAEYGNGKMISSYVTFMISPSVNISIDVKTPFPMFTSSKISLTHTGPLNNCRSHLHFLLMNYTATGDTNLRFGSVIDAGVSLTSNVKGAERASAKLLYDITPSHIAVSASASLQDDAFEGSVTGEWDKQWSNGSISVKSPFKNFRETIIDFHCSKVWNKNSSASLTFMDGKEIVLTVESIPRKNRYHWGKIELKTPFEKFKVYSMEVEGSNKHPEHYFNVTFVYGTGKTITFDTVVEDDNKLFQISFIAQTPFPKFEYNKAAFGVNGRKDNFTGHMKIEFYDTEIYLVSHFSDDKAKTGDLDIKTNIPNYETIHGTFNIKCCKEYLNATSTLSVNGESVETVLIIDDHPTEGQIFGFTVKTPFANFRNIGFYLHKYRMNQTLLLQLSIPYMDGKMIAANMTEIEKDFNKIKLELSTPFTGYENQEMIITVPKFRRCCYGHLGMKVKKSGGETMDIAVAYKIQPYIDLNLTVLSNDTGGRLHIKNVMDSNIPVESEFRTELYLPYEGYEKQIIGYKHLFSNNTLEGNLDLVEVEGINLSVGVTGMAEFNTMEGKVDVASNLNGLEDMVIMFSKKGKLSNVRLAGGIKVMDVEVSMNHLQSQQHQYTNCTLSIKREKPVYVKLYRQVVDKTMEGEIFVSWDTEDPNRNIRFLTSMTDRSRYSRVDKSLKMRLIHPLRSLTVLGNVQHTQQRTQSHGELIWNGNSEHKVFYDIDMKDISRRHRKMYDGSVKIGCPVRSVQMDGSYSDTGTTVSLDGTFYWDVDRDSMKKAGVTAVLTPRERNKRVDLSLKLPSIEKDISVASEVAINDGPTLFRGQTKISYSRNSQKTLVLNTQVENLSHGGRNFNYSIDFGLSHPYTDIDVKMTSHLGCSTDKYTSGVDLWYLTNWNERKNFVVRGEISKKTKEAKLLVVNPLKEMELSGAIQRNPYQLVIQNKYGERLMKAGVTADIDKRLVDVQTTYDIDDVDKTLHLTTSYLNSSNVQASVYHGGESKTVVDSLVNFRLNASRLLHAKLSWRPQTIEEIQAYLTTKVEQNSLEIKSALDSVYEAVGEELSGKYARITQDVAEEVTPFLSLLDTEVAAFEGELDTLRRNVRRMYIHNEEIMKVAGNYLDQANIIYKRTLNSVTASLTSTMKKVRKLMKKMEDFPIRQHYDELLSDPVERIKSSIDSAVDEAKEAISRLDDLVLTVCRATGEQYLDMQKTVQDSMERVVELPRTIDNNLQISNTVTPYLNSMYTNAVEHYGNLKNMVTSSGEGITSYIVDAKQRKDLQTLYTITKEIYDTGVSTYSQWKGNKGEITNSIIPLPATLEQRAEDYLQDMVFYYKPDVTVWDVENGLIHVDFYLPIPLKSLDTLSYIQQAKEISKCIPVNSTINTLYYKYLSLWHPIKHNVVNMFI